MTELVVDDLRFRYPGSASSALDGVSLAIGAGEVVLVAGPSGCGKSTLALALAGLIPNRIRGRVAGEVRFRGETLTGLEPHQVAQRIGMVFQDPSSQLVCPSVEAEVAFGPENLGLERAEIGRRVEECMGATGIAGRSRATTASLSGGEKQRLAIAATLAMSPDVLVLDEPCSDLDPAGTQEVLGVLRRLNRQRGTTVVLVEHRIDEVVPWVDRVVLLDRGRVVLDRPTAAAFDRVAPWRDLGVAVPEVVQVAHAIPEPFAGRVPLSSGEVVTALADTPWARRLADPPPGPRPVGDGCGPGGGEAATGRPAGAGRSVVGWQRVSLAYDHRRVLDGVDLDVRAGDWLALAGPNGSGKTSLLELAMGFQAPTGGSVSVSGRPVRVGSVSRQARDVGYLFQAADTMLFTSTVAREVGFALRHRRTRRGQVTAAERARVDELLTLVGLDDRRGDDPFTLSAGQRQRLAIAALLVASPPTLILDEPTTGQDEGHARAVLGFLERLRAEAGLTYLMVTHDMRIVARHATRLAVLCEGRVVADGPPSAVFARPEVLDAAHLVAPPAAEIHRGLVPRSDRVSLSVDELLGRLGVGPTAAVGTR